MRPVLIGFTENCALKWQSVACRQFILRVMAILLLLFCLVFAAFMAWKMIFYIAWQFGAQVRDSFPLVYETSMFLKMAAAHPKLPFFAHGIAGTVAMVSGAVQFLMILRGVKSRWHAVLGKTYAVSAIIASTTAIPLAWSLHHDMLLTSIAYSAGAAGWCLATFVAVQTIISGDLERHIAWCIRSYSFLAMVVTARLLLASGAIAGSGDWGFDLIKLQYAVTIVATFFLNWGLGEWIVARVMDRRRKMSAQSAGSSTIARPVTNTAYAVQASRQSRQPNLTIGGRRRVLEVGA
ncbi:DUF2306 domain-containing protein [Roseibium sp. HPY-6]|uniref:DUF2306 domain-containing protein n=1 Tax=Roseibium sp. HPY-6 TaxID=3229852 RepID=UPI00338F260E